MPRSKPAPRANPRKNQTLVRDVATALAFIAACQVVGVLGSLATLPAIPTWYAALAKPWFTPPSWAFAPAWTLLYALMGLAAYLVYHEGKQRADVRNALALFTTQLALNAAWPFAFFGLQNPLAGLATITALWLAIAYTIQRFARINKTAAWLLAPYLLWVTYALALNYAIWTMN